MSADTVFDLVDERGWRRGLGNLMKGQFSGWFQSSRWWRHALIWLATINLILFFATLGMSGEAENEAGDSPLILYSIFGGIFVAIGVMIIMQGVIVGEKRSGTAAPGGTCRGRRDARARVPARDPKRGWSAVAYRRWVFRHHPSAWTPTHAHRLRHQSRRTE